MSEDVKTDIEEVLNAAIDETENEDSSTELSVEDEGDDSESSEKESKKGKGANERIQKLLAQEKQLNSKLEEVNKTLSTRDSELGKMVDLLQARENDSQVVAKINELYQDSKYKPFIEYLDKIVRGEEVDTVPEFSSKKSEDVGSNKGADILRRLDEKAEELEEAFAEREAELILKQADRHASDWLAELPKEYGNEDKKILSETVAERVDWDAIEEAGGRNLEEELLKGFKATIEWYGKPKGLSSTEQKTLEKDPEDEVKKLRSFVEQDWGRMKDVEVGGVKSRVPQVSEEEFSRSMAQILKRRNATSGI